MLRRVLLALLAFLILLGGLAVWKRDEIGRLRAVLSLFEAPVIVANFSAMDRAFLSVTLPRGDGPVSPLPQGEPMVLDPETEAWIAARTITALVVLKDGRIVHESYRQGTAAGDRRISWSVAKSFLSALFGIVAAEGAFDSLDDPVTKYAPVLVGSAYDGVTLRQLLTMTSGLRFNEDYLDFGSDINRMGRVLALGRSMDGFAAGLSERVAEPGARWQYVSIDTHVLGLVIRGATGRGIAGLMAEKVIAPLGLEADPYYVTDGYGEPFVLGGLNLTTRDYARFGLMMMRGGAGIVPADWVAESTRPQAATPPGALGYGYQWWVPQGAEPGEFMAQGIYGQHIYVDTAAGVVIASNAADRGFREPGVEAANIATFRRIAAALR
ncbi:MAG TPA: serine hydrolase domain-containing protein [Paracoccaceae bacterium]|nr:serine hydrolase domain-containing protein [Paracoccaceae bacterium]HMO72886.1 serine hydrolase domain-containing protein [Paracoccaceae bacterium]